MRKIRNKNMAILLVIFIVTLASSIGYSALQSNLKVTVDLNVLKNYIPDGTLYGMMHHISEMDNVSSKYVQNSNGIDFSQISSDTNGKGVYELHTTASDKYPIYYYRGDVNNNLIFANFCWKIIRTTETGGVKLIYNGEPSDDGKCDNMGASTQIGTSAYNESYDNSKYVGYKYDNDEVDSTIKIKVDTWYKENIEEKYSSYLEDTIFCNDRSSRVSGSNVLYGAYDRNYYNGNRKPSIVCPQEEDKFTVANSKLTYPVGLITMDEVAYAGGVRNIANNTYYLYTNQWYWTMSPFYFYDSHADLSGVGSTGNLHNYYAGYSNGDNIRPVLSLKHETKYLSGNGTKETPFLITPLPEKPKSVYEVMKANSVLDNIKSTYVSNANGVDFSKTSSDTNGKGIYELHTTASDEYPIYYYRGEVKNNNIIFANFCWKIIRTTSSGGVKLIYNGKPSEDGKCNESGMNVQLPNERYNNISDNDKYVGYKYDNDEVDSNIKIKIDSWYEENLKDKYSSYIEDLEFCNDRSITNKDDESIYHGAYNRLLENRLPSLNCPQEEDKFTVSSGKLKYPVGLITADEVVYAGSVHYDTGSNPFYLLTGNPYWTMSPSLFVGNNTFVWFVSDLGAINSGGVRATERGIRPVINLSKKVKILGLGTVDNPYIIE